MLRPRSPKRIAGRIIALESAGKHSQALELAFFGLELNPTHQKVWDFYRAVDAWRDGMNGICFPMLRGLFAIPKPTRETIKLLKRSEKAREKWIVKLFCDAVNKHDWPTILDIADAVQFFKGKRQDYIPADPDRFCILLLKSFERRFTLEEIESYLQCHHPLKEKRDRNTLRTKCKALGLIPISMRKQRRKKS
jgi:hypothetical protein